MFSSGVLVSRLMTLARRPVSTSCRVGGAVAESCNTLRYVGSGTTPYGTTLSAVRGYGTKPFNEPLSANELPRPAGICSLFRLPIQQDTAGLDVCFVGVPLDGGTSNRSGTRLGPRQIRTESVLVRPCNKETGAAPFRSLQVADVGDVFVTMYDMQRAAQDIRSGFSKLISGGCKTLAMGGDHFITYPILQAHKDKYGPLGLVHIDAHLDTADHQNDCSLTHATPFRRAGEEGLLDPSKVVQIGIRGSAYTLNDYEWSLKQGFRVVPARHCYHANLPKLMAEIRHQMGDAPVYVSFDIDALDPAYAPGTGTPEIGGLSTSQALEILWGLRGVNIVGGDLVEVSPPYDPHGTTALTAANLLFEMLCVLPGVEYDPVMV